MTASRPPEPPVEGTTVLTRDPVRISWVIYGFVQAVIVVLLATEAITAQQGAIITGIALAAYAAISELFVRKETVPLQPLNDLAAAQAAAAKTNGTATA